MKTSLTTFFNVSKYIHAAYRYGGPKAFIDEFERFIGVIDRRSSKKKQPIDIQFSALVASVLGHFLEHDSKKVIAKTAEICDAAWLSSSTEDKKRHLIEQMTLFVESLDRQPKSMSEQVCAMVEKATLQDFKDLSVNTLADHFNLSFSHFSRTFKAEQGRSLQDYLLSAKLNCAFDTLQMETNGLHVNEIAEALGFTSPDHFRKVFKRKYGFPPSEMVNRFQEGREGTQGEPPKRTILPTLTEKILSGIFFKK